MKRRRPREKEIGGGGRNDERDRRATTPMTGDGNGDDEGCGSRVEQQGWREGDPTTPDSADRAQAGSRYRKSATMTARRRITGARCHNRR